MIKANELRIGNLFQEGEVMAIPNEAGEGVVLRTIALGFNELTPIPLTEEWLLKFGFEKTGYSRWTLNGFVRLSCDFIYANGKVILSRGEYPSELIIESIEFVHQLQNLYYALCGEELPIKHAPA